MELTDRLQSEQHLGRENKIKANTLDTEVTTIKEKLHYKDEEMIRLSHENEELNKKNLQNSQELDRLRHYESKAQNNIVLQQQLQHANDSIKRLRVRVKELENASTKSPAVDENSSEETSLLPDNNDEVASVQSVVDEAEDVLSDTVSISSTVNIATEEAMDKLQQRFTRTMSEIADLTEEKNRLEHLVMQLQGETETIGEYIALYQNQRRLLKQREVEKDVQVQQIIRDREEMKEKLQKLNNLVEQLLVQKGIGNSEKMMAHIKHKDLNGFGDTQQGNNPDNADQTNGRIVMDEENANEMVVEKSVKPINSVETASQILNLLSEIQDKNQNQKFDTPSSDVHHCACCYGKLETV